MMKQYLVTGPYVALRAGTVSLTPGQYAARAHVVTPAGLEGLYRIDGETCFKRGEQFGYDGELNTLQAQALGVAPKPAPVGVPVADPGPVGPKETPVIDPGSEGLDETLLAEDSGELDLAELKRLTSLPGKNLVKEIKAITSPELLQELNEAELSREAPREAVVEALEKQFEEINKAGEAE